MVKMSSSIVPTELIRQIGSLSLINIKDLLKHLESFEGMEIVCTDSLVCTPFYVVDGRRYELYAFEIEIDPSSLDSIESFIHKHIVEIDDSEIRSKIIALSGSSSVGQSFLAWLLYVTYSKAVMEDVVIKFGVFDADNLYVELV